MWGYHKIKARENKYFRSVDKTQRGFHTIETKKMMPRADDVQRRHTRNDNVTGGDAPQTKTDQVARTVWPPRPRAQLSQHLSRRAVMAYRHSYLDTKNDFSIQIGKH